MILKLEAAKGAIERRPRPDPHRRRYVARRLCWVATLGISPLRSRGTLFRERRVLGTVVRPLKRFFPADDAHSSTRKAWSRFLSSQTRACEIHKPGHASLAAEQFLAYITSASLWS